MSNFFATSDEFIDRYGQVDDAGFVELVYNNVMGRAPDAVGGSFWLDQLVTGDSSRAKMLIFFSESKEFVKKTDTFPPLAGYFSWYPAGTTWYCGSGSAGIAFENDPSCFDLLIFNASEATANFDMYTVDSLGQVSQGALELDARQLEVVFNLESSGFAELGWETDSTTFWTFVDSPMPLPESRSGW